MPLPKHSRNMVRGVRSVLIGMGGEEIPENRFWYQLDSNGKAGTINIRCDSAEQATEFVRLLEPVFQQVLICEPYAWRKQHEVHVYVIRQFAMEEEK